MTISVVTPSLNQAPYVEATLLSVLGGDRAPDEYIVVDGGSTDGTVDVIRRHASRLTRWRSQPDDGQYDAIQKGFDDTNGEVMAWLNAGDLYMPWTLSVVCELFDRFSDLEWLTTQRPLTSDDHGRVVSCEFIGGFARRSFQMGSNLPGGSWFARAGIQQESTFWRRSLWERAGAKLATDLHFAGDFELWLRFFEHSVLHSLDAPLAAHRIHPGQKTESLAEYVQEATSALARAGHTPVRSRNRAAVYKALGRRPLRQLPRAIAEPLVFAGLLHRTQTIVWRDGAWLAADDYAV